MSPDCLFLAWPGLELAVSNACMEYSPWVLTGILKIEFLIVRHLLVHCRLGYVYVCTYVRVCKSYEKFGVIMRVLTGFHTASHGTHTSQYHNPCVSVPTVVYDDGSD